MRIPIAQYLRDCGYKVIEAVSADEAMTVLLHREIVVDVVFSDIEMPGSVDGFGLAKWIREHRPGLDVVLAGTLPRTVECTFAACLRHARMPKSPQTDEKCPHNAPLVWSIRSPRLIVPYIFGIWTARGSNWTAGGLSTVYSLQRPSGAGV